MTQPPSGQPQPCPRCKQPIEGSVAVHYAEHHGEYIPLHLERQGQPQPEPGTWYVDRCDACGHYRKSHTATLGDCYEPTMYGPCSCTGFIEQGQPQQEPARPWYRSTFTDEEWNAMQEVSQLLNDAESKPAQERHQEPASQAAEEHYWGLNEPEIDPELERQAGGHHVHEREGKVIHGDTYADDAELCKVCGFAEIHHPSWWDGYEQGVADARRQ